MELKPGITGSSESFVTRSQTARSMDSGALEVFATPAMIAGMESLCLHTAEPYLDPGTTTVGTRLEISHLSPTPEGAPVRYECTLTSVEGRKLVFSVAAYDHCGLIGAGIHERYIVTVGSFTAKVSAKAEKIPV